MAGVIHKRLEFVEELSTVDILAGYFLYEQPDGSQVEAEFYVRCLAVNGDPEIAEEQQRDKLDTRVDAYNQQYSEQYLALQSQGCRRIIYKEVHPSPFF